MKKYTVRVERTTVHTCEIEIEAESQEDAENIVEDTVEDDCCDLAWKSEEFEYSKYDVERQPF